MRIRNFLLGAALLLSPLAASDPVWGKYGAIVDDLPNPSPTGISSPAVRAEKKRGSRAYDLSGRAVAPDSKGVVIRNGKKFLNK